MPPHDRRRLLHTAIIVHYAAFFRHKAPFADATPLRVSRLPLPRRPAAMPLLKRPARYAAAPATD